MMSTVEPDRREFIGAIVPAAIGVSIAAGTSVPLSTNKPPKIGDTLKPSTGNEVLSLPYGANGRLGSPRMRVNGYVNRIQFSPKGDTLVAASSELRAWDPRTGKVTFRFGYPDNNSIDGGRLTSRDTFVLLMQSGSGGNYEFRHYEFRTGKLIA